MTVEIVNPEPDESVKKEIICRECGVKLSYLPIDIKDGRSTDYTGGSDSYRYIECPNCKHRVKIGRG